MRYLAKRDDSKVVAEQLSYERKSDRIKIRAALLAEQSGYCAYSERFVGSIDSSHVEHFDPRLKSTSGDGYKNWYVVLSWLNEHKPKKIERFLPILDPSSDLSSRIRFERGRFHPCDMADIEADNLIKFLRWNDPDVVKDRDAHIARIRKQLAHGMSWEVIADNDPGAMSYATALIAELGVVIHYEANQP